MPTRWSHCCRAASSSWKFQRLLQENLLFIVENLNIIPLKTRAEPCPIPYEVSLWLSCLWTSCHFSFSRVSNFQTKSLLILMVSIAFLIWWKKELKHLPQHSTSPDFHSEVSTNWFNSDSIIQCLSAAIVTFSSALIKFKHYVIYFWGYFPSLSVCLAYPL